MAVARCILGKFLGVGYHFFPPLLDVPTFCDRCLHVQRRERPPAEEGGTLCGREMFRQISPRTRLPRHSRDLLHAANMRHGTDGFTSPPKEGVLRSFSPLKFRRLRPGLNPWFITISSQIHLNSTTALPPTPFVSCLPLHYYHHVTANTTQSENAPFYHEAWFNLLSPPKHCCDKSCCIGYFRWGNTKQGTGSFLIVNVFLPTNRFRFVFYLLSTGLLRLSHSPL
jgi:hypothetical protein